MGRGLHVVLWRQGHWHEVVGWLRLWNEEVLGHRFTLPFGLPVGLPFGLPPELPVAVGDGGLGVRHDRWLGLGLALVSVAFEFGLDFSLLDPSLLVLKELAGGWLDVLQLKMVLQALVLVQSSLLVLE